jgi:hypothetical protein
LYFFEIVAIVEQLSSVHEVINEHIINEWKYTQLYSKNWVWPDCARVQGWLRNMADVALWLNHNTPTSCARRVLQTIFNDTFIPGSISSRLIIFDRNMTRKCVTLAFRHLLSEYFTPAESKPVILLLTQTQVESIAEGVQLQSCAPIANNLGENEDQGPDHLVVKHDGLRIGNPRGRGNRNSGDQPGPSTSPTKKPDTCTNGHRARREKYWFLSELFVLFHGFTEYVKVNSHN